MCECGDELVFLVVFFKQKTAYDVRISDWSADVCSADLRGQTVVYADRFTPEAEKQRAEREGGEARAVPFLKRFTVFNVAQCEGLRDDLASDPAPLPERELVPLAEEVIDASRVVFRIGGDTAFYAPGPALLPFTPQDRLTVGEGRDVSVQVI